MPALLENKKIFFNYEILERFEAGLELLGTEVKSLKSKHGSIAGARVIARGSEAYIIGMEIPPYQPLNAPRGYDPERTRRLLLRKKEIAHLVGKAEERGLTIVPIRVYTSHNLLKVEIALVRGKKKFEKREKIKKRDTERDLLRDIKGGA